MAQNQRATFTAVAMTGTYTPTELAAALGLTRQTVHKLTRAGVIEQIQPGLYSTKAIAQYCDHLRRAIEGAGAGRGLTRERAALLREKTAIARMERQQLDGTLIRRDKIVHAFVDVIRVARARLLAVPRFVAPRLLGCKNPAEAEKCIYDAIWDALDELSKTPSLPAL
jgi:hypothetical protein